MSTNHSDDLTAQVADAFERMHVPPAPSVRETMDMLRERAPAAFDAAQQRQRAPVVWKRIASRGRGLMRRPLPRLMLAAAACLAMVATWLLISGQQPAIQVKSEEPAPEGATGLLAASEQSTFQAFNMLAEALLEAKSATFKMRINIKGQVNQSFQSYYLAPGKMRNETQGMLNLVNITDLPAGKFVSLAAAHKLAFIMNMKNREARANKPQLDDVFEQMRMLLDKTRDAKEDKFERLGEKGIDGRPAIGFSHASAIERMTLWGDPTTGLPVLVEMVWSGSPHTEITMSHFELDEKLDPALFDTTPPEGYQVQTIDVDVSEPTEATLIEALRLYADWNDGLFADNLGMASSIAALITKASTVRKENRKLLPTEQIGQFAKMTQGLEFVSGLPESADVHYAGKGVKLGEPGRPIFWYKPEGAKTYRVIYADLTVKDAETAPEVAGAVRLEKTKPAEKYDEELEK